MEALSIGTAMKRPAKEKRRIAEASLSNAEEKLREAEAAH